LWQIRLHGKVGFRQIQRVFEFRGHARSLSTPKKAGNFIIGDGFNSKETHVWFGTAGVRI
jgi:hypothetical protein